MPVYWLPRQVRKKTWKTMTRYQRKEFHRENEIRRLAGKPLKSKP